MLTVSLCLQRWLDTKMVLFNAEELELIASAPPHNFSKEGLLYMKPLSKKASKKAKKTQDGKTSRNVFD